MHMRGGLELVANAHLCVGGVSFKGGSHGGTHELLCRTPEDYPCDVRTNSLLPLLVAQVHSLLRGGHLLFSRCPQPSDYN